NFLEIYSIAEDLARVAERLDAPSSLRAAEGLIAVLKNAEKIPFSTEPLSKALIALCRRLDADGASRVADAIARAVQDPGTLVMARPILASGFPALVEKLEPDKVAPLETALVDVLIANLAGESVPSPVWQAQVLASLCGHPGTKSA